MTSDLILLARTTGENPNLLDGFYGESFREFAMLGVATIRHQYQARSLPNEKAHHAAGLWLGVQEAAEKREAKGRHRTTAILGALGLGIAAGSFVAGFFTGLSK